MAILRPRVKTEPVSEAKVFRSKASRKGDDGSSKDGIVETASRVRVAKSARKTSRKSTSTKTELTIKSEEPQESGSINEAVALLPSGHPRRPSHPLLKPPKDAYFGLIQESLTHNLFHLLIQTCLWNQTRGLQARPVLLKLLELYPTPELLAAADLESLTELLRPIGLHNIRAVRLIKFAETWLACPPTPEKRYRRVDYPSKGDGRDIKPSEVLGLDDEREAWEVAHLPGVGAYALDSYRIFIRDEFRGVDPSDEDIVPEWKKVVPLDKPLRNYLVWRWEREGWSWDPISGKRKAKT